MKAKIVDKSELKKTPEERQAETLLRRLKVDNAIEVVPDGTSARTVRRMFTKAATTLGLDIELRAKDDKVYILLKQEKSNHGSEEQ